MDKDNEPTMDAEVTDEQREHADAPDGREHIIRALNEALRRDLRDLFEQDRAA